VCPDEQTLLLKALFTNRGTAPLFRHEVKHFVTDIIEGALTTTEAIIDNMEGDACCSIDVWQQFSMRLL
jgi:hypothetical protein